MRSELWPDCPAERRQLEVEQLLSSDGLVVVAEIGDSLVGFAEASMRRDHVEGTSISPVAYVKKMRFEDTPKRELQRAASSHH